MSSIKNVLVAVLSFSALAQALPRTFSKRQAPPPSTNPQAAAAGVTDVDILQFALTLENLETAFYQQGFAKFPDADFTAAGLTATDITNLKSVAVTESTHVTTLTGAVTGAGFAPVAACTYNFGFTTASAMIATAGVLENIGVSAYMGAAPLVASPAILTVAAEILTVESRHQTFIRTASKIAAIPSAFDTPLGIKSVFSMAAPFIASCPEGSNLKLTAFPPITMTAAAGAPAGANATAMPTMPVGTNLALTTTATGATECAFVNGGTAGGSVFVPFTNGACAVPAGVSGVAYVHLTNAAPADNVLTDAIVVAGVLPIVVT